MLQSRLLLAQLEAWELKLICNFLMSKKQKVSPSQLAMSEVLEREFKKDENEVYIILSFNYNKIPASISFTANQYSITFN